jgi:formamidopyrimidine-DNA glycosylase
VPELPEVETTRLGLLPHLYQQIIVAQTWRRKDLRWPVDEALSLLTSQRIDALSRRAKYLLVHTQLGDAIWHLGMSGSLRVVPPETALKTHDHICWQLSSGLQLRFHDPRRFGCYLFQAPGEVHALLSALGPEPLSDAFNAAYLKQYLRTKTAGIKTVIMDQACVVGVGNIYAAESLFHSGIHPATSAKDISLARLRLLVDAIKAILSAAIARGGTTLRDFLDPQGEPGYFAQELWVYGRAGENCKRCHSVIRSLPTGTRQSNYCPKCQKNSSK